MAPPFPLGERGARPLSKHRDALRSAKRLFLVQVQECRQLQIGDLRAPFWHCLQLAAKLLAGASAVVRARKAWSDVY